MSIGPATWEALEAGPAVDGNTRLRIHPESAQDLFLSVVKPGLRRRLVLELDALPAEAQEPARDSKGIRVLVENGTAARVSLVVELADRLFAPVFDPLVSDIAGAAASATDGAAAAASLLLRLEFWRSLLRDLDAGGMSRTRRRGLVGELLCLRDVLVAQGSAPMAMAVQAWTGPLATNQDFEFPGGAVEVKATTAKKPQALVITNERELDAKGAGTVVLVALSLDERQGGEGESLNAIVDGLRNAIADPDTVQTFSDRLAAYGYLPAQRDQYDEPRYTVRDVAAWDVRGDFPRIVEGDLRDGVGDVEYRIVTSGLGPYAVAVGAVAGMVNRGAP